MLRKFILIGFPMLLALTACATDPNNYVQPQASSGLATIHGTGWGSMFGDYKTARIDQIDGKNVGVGWYAAKVKVAAGHHIITVHNYFARKYGEQFDSTADIMVEMKAGNDYRTEFVVVGANIESWIALDNGSLVSKKISTPYKQIFIG